MQSVLQGIRPLILSESDRYPILPEFTYMIKDKSSNRTIDAVGENSRDVLLGTFPLVKALQNLA
jgi:hypothetical protein